MHHCRYIKQKWYKAEIKVIKLCAESDYITRLKIYGGKLDVRKTLLTHCVMELCKSILKVGQMICTDNWYASIDLPNKLLDQQTHLVWAMRKVQDATWATKIEKVDIIAKENHEEITILSWKDNWNILILSAKHSN